MRTVTVIVAVISELPGLVAVNCGTLPVPDAAKPIAGFELVHVTLAPAGIMVKLLLVPCLLQQYRFVQPHIDLHLE